LLKVTLFTLSVCVCLPVVGSGLLIGTGLRLGCRQS